MKVDTWQFSMYLLFYAKISIRELKLGYTGRNKEKYKFINIHQRTKTTQTLGASDRGISLSISIRELKRLNKREGNEVRISLSISIRELKLKNA